MACNVTAKSGASRGLENALTSNVKGKLQGNEIMCSISRYYLEY